MRNWFSVQSYFFEYYVDKANHLRNQNYFLQPGRNLRTQMGIATLKRNFLFIQQHDYFKLFHQVYRFLQKKI